MVQKNMLPKRVGEYTQYDFCRFCRSKNIDVFLDLGYMPLAGGFLKDLSTKTLMNEKYYPLQLMLCTDCFLVQTNSVISADVLFKDYFYHSSKINTLVKHFQDVASSVPAMFSEGKNKFIVEIGCNDGIFIQALQQINYQVVGVDPAENIVTPIIKNNVPIINDYFTELVAKKIVKEYGQADAIYSFNTLAHIENMHDVFKGISIVLKPSGYLAFEVHYLGILLKEIQYDMIYHEHQYYYSLLAIQSFLKQHNMHVFDIKMVPIHAGSIRFYVQKNGSGKRKITQAVKDLLVKEKKEKLHTRLPYIRFANKISKTREELLAVLTLIRSQGKSVIGYGASGRGTVITNYCQLDSQLLDYVIDDSPAKQHIYMPGVHLKTYSSKKLYGRLQPDYVVLFAWSFLDEILQRHKKYIRNKGKFIVPLPRVTVIENE